MKDIFQKFDYDIEEIKKHYQNLTFKDKCKYIDYLLKVIPRDEQLIYDEDIPDELFFELMFKVGSEELFANFLLERLSDIRYFAEEEKIKLKLSQPEQDPPKTNQSQLKTSQSQWEWGGNQIELIEIAFALFKTTGVIKNNNKDQQAKFISDFAHFFNLDINKSAINSNMTNIRKRNESSKFLKKLMDTLTDEQKKYYNDENKK